MNIHIFQVGGSIRDELLGVKSKDIDFAVEAPSFDAMRQEIVNRGGKIFLETPKFLTIRANVPDIGSADFVLCRKDRAYSDGRRPDEVTVGDIFDDLARRDFTMNAIARNVRTKAIIDPHMGVEDIEQRIIRCVGNPLQRFTEDKLRVFRALRFSVTKDFSVEPETVAAMRVITTRNSNFDAVSTERIREELLKMFAHDWLESFLALREFDLLDLIEARGIWFKPTIEKA